jgi:hypothetical protein
VYLRMTFSTLGIYVVEEIPDRTLSANEVSLSKSLKQPKSGHFNNIQQNIQPNIQEFGIIYQCKTTEIRSFYGDPSHNIRNILQ